MLEALELLEPLPGERESTFFHQTYRYNHNAYANNRQVVGLITLPQLSLPFSVSLKLRNQRVQELTGERILLKKS